MPTRSARHPTRRRGRGAGAGKSSLRRLRIVARQNEPLRHPTAPGLSLAGFQLVVALTTPWGFPCCVRFPCVHAAATTPAQRLGVVFAQSPSRVSLPRTGCRVGLRIVLFEVCSAFTLVAACTLALSPIRDTHSEGFSQFVTSLAAPVAFGWSVCRVGLAPTGKRRLITAHTQYQTPWAGPVSARHKQR